VRGHFGQRGEADVGHAEEGVGDACAGDVDRVEAGVLDRARGQRIRGAREQGGLAGFEHLAELEVERRIHDEGKFSYPSSVIGEGGDGSSVSSKVSSKR